MDYKLLIIKILVIFTSYLVFLKINKKISLSKFCEDKLRLGTQLRVFIFCSVLYALLMFIPTFMEEYLNIYYRIIEIVDWIIVGVIISLWREISSNVPINDKSWFG